ncbi:merozoite TRAP-like protein, putative [Plasmodium vinckei vinckei]|uniref:Merozoite TRAP-like protein, putative n=1 Tax=Plasmodium vinckei vinckei TaxID=54757 RepID=A0A081IC63_PLAVN|nr:merozoite TRAP-like protein, putative [Plasmodium vinckei vinckei]KEG01271.1 hypothetical protein YYE_03859 [Plasmodium vinckei vinckei]VEV55248.1 merozoite TRAP-like protein, putative [Plasmodium vinckei vinckei]
MKTHITSYLYAYVLFVIIQIKYNSANETCDNWGPWSPCDKNTTTRVCLNSPSLKEAKHCTNCNEWSEWLECKDGKRSRHIINCPYINETQDCLTDINGEVIYKNSQLNFDNLYAEHQKEQSSKSKGNIKTRFLQTQDNSDPVKTQDSTQKETTPSSEATTQEKKQDKPGTDQAAINQAAGISTGISEEKNVPGTGSETTATSKDNNTIVTTDGQTIEGGKADVKSGEDTLKSTTEEETSKVNTDKGSSAPVASGEEVKVTNAIVPGTDTLESPTSVVSTPDATTVEVTGKKETNGEEGATDERLKQKPEGVSQTEETLGNKESVDNSAGDVTVDKSEESTGQGSEGISKVTETGTEGITPIVPENAGTDSTSVLTSDPSPIHEGKSVRESPELSATTNERDAVIMRSTTDPIISEVNTNHISSPTLTMEDRNLNNIYNRNSDLNLTSMHTYNDLNVNDNLHSHMNSRYGESMGRSYKFGALRNGLPSNYHGHNGPYRDMHHMGNSNNLYQSSYKSNLRNNGHDESHSEYNNGHNEHNEHNGHCNCSTNNANEESNSHESHRAYGNEERNYHNRYRQSGYNNSEGNDHYSKIYVASGMGIVILLSGAVATYALNNDKNKKNNDYIFSNGFADIPASKMVHEDEFWGTE